MAEILGLISSILAIAETGAKVATTLGKLSVQLKNAGKEAKEIARKIKLVSKVLKQIEAKLRNGQGAIDLSLVEEYILLCEERMEEATRLVTMLESEMSSPRTWDRAKFRIRFILEKSTFTLLQQDMDSLQMTLDLYVTTLTYQQVGKNEAMLEDIHDRLVELKQEIEDDLQIRSAGATVNAAILTVQYNNLFIVNDPIPSQSGSSVGVTEEFGSDNGDDQSESAGQSPDQSLALLMSRSDTGSYDGTRSISLNILDDETVSKALVVFTQIQTVQKKTLRRINIELKRGPESDNTTTSAPSVKSVVVSDDGIYAKPSISEPIHAQKPSEVRPAEVGEDTLQTSGASEEALSDISGQDPVARSSMAHVVSAETAIQKTASEAAERGAQLEEQQQRELLADKYPQNHFSIVHCKTKKTIKISFVSLKKSLLSDIVLDMHVVSLGYDPPQPGLAHPGKKPSDYQPPPMPSVARRRRLFASLTAAGADAQASLEAFATYVNSYAQWYSDSCRSTALQHHEYFFSFGERYIKNCYDHVAIDAGYEYLLPGHNIRINFSTRQLLEGNMIIFTEKTSRREWCFVEEGPHNEDLKRLSSLNDQYVYSDRANFKY